MELNSAIRLANKLGGAFPGRNLQAVNIRTWADELVELDFETATKVVWKLVHRSQDPPSVAQLRQCISEVTQQTFSPRELEGSDAAEGITLAEFLERNPAMRERIERIHDDVGRLLEADEDTTEIAAKRGAAELLRHPNVCNGAGKKPATRDDVDVCPDCGVPIKPIVMRTDIADLVGGKGEAGG